MANRYPLIVDTADGNKIKELPNGDNLNLSGCGIINVASVAVLGSITADSVTVNGQSLSTIALSGSYNDLIDKPTIINNYNQLIGTPTIPTITSQLNDVSNILPTVGQTLIWDGIEYVPGEVQLSFDISDYNIGDLNNVITVGDTTNKFFKYYSGAWRAANITWTDVQSRPTALSEFTNDAGYITAAQEGQTLSIIGSQLTISDGNTINLNTIYDQDLNTTDDVTFSRVDAGVVVADLIGGDLSGSVFADDSTLLVDAVNGEIPGYVKISDLKTALQDGLGDYAAFKAWVLANL